MAGYIPSRGDIVKMSLSPQSGHEQAGWRPALVISPKAYDAASSSALFCPITSTSKDYPFEVPLADETQTAGVVLADQIRSLDWRARRARFVETAPATVVAEVMALLEPLVT